MLGHPFVVGELACGKLRNRAAILTSMQKLPQALLAIHEEVLRLIEERELMGRGSGYVEVHLLAAVLPQGSATLWTRDKRLAAVADAMAVSDA